LKVLHAKIGGMNAGEGFFNRRTPLCAPATKSVTEASGESGRAGVKIQRPLKQRHTSKRIFERLRDDHGYRGGLTIVKDYALFHAAAGTAGVRAATA